MNLNLNTHYQTKKSKARIQFHIQRSNIWCACPPQRHEGAKSVLALRWLRNAKVRASGFRRQSMVDLKQRLNNISLINLTPSQHDPRSRHAQLVPVLCEVACWSLENGVKRSFNNTDSMLRLIFSRCLRFRQRIIRQKRDTPPLVLEPRKILCQKEPQHYNLMLRLGRAPASNHLIKKRYFSFCPFGCCQRFPSWATRGLPKTHRP